MSFQEIKIPMDLIKKNKPTKVSKIKASSCMQGCSDDYMHVPSCNHLTGSHTLLYCFMASEVHHLKMASHILTMWNQSLVL
jgi:hypothetical protein